MEQERLEAEVESLEEEKKKIEEKRPKVDKLVEDLQRHLQENNLGKRLYLQMVQDRR